MSLLALTTPVILTFNEEPNLPRCLASLSWAEDIVVVDSGSTDATKVICCEHPKVRLFERPFDSHAAQWSFAVFETGVATPWVLALDSDYGVTDAFRAELDALPNDPAESSFWCTFKYAQLGRILRSSVYPPVRALFRKDNARYEQDGHTQRVVVEGLVGRLAAPLIHDDRKSFEHWLKSQQRYAKLEGEKLLSSPSSARSFIRTRTPFAPIAMGFYCLVLRGGVFEGPAGWLYALQRMAAEAMIGCALWDARLRRSER